VCIRPNESGCTRYMQGIFDTWRYSCGYIGALEWSWPCRSWLATDVSALSVAHRYDELKCNMSLSIISRCLKPDSRNGEAEGQGETEVTALYYCVMSERISAISKSLGMKLGSHSFHSKDESLGPALRFQIPMHPVSGCAQKPGTSLLFAFRWAITNLQ
jgi:hypothetical protein